MSLQNCFGLMYRGLNGPRAASLVEEGGAIPELFMPRLTLKKRLIDPMRLHKEHDMDCRSELWFSVK